MEELRTVQKSINNDWQTIAFQELKNGDTFRMFEPDGNPVTGLKKETEFLATSDPYWHDNDGTWAINTKD